MLGGLGGNYIWAAKLNCFIDYNVSINPKTGKMRNSVEAG